MTQTLFTTFLLASHDPIDHVKRHYLFNLGPFEVTNQMAMAVVAAILMAITFLWVFNGKDLHEPPSGLRNFFESIMEFLRVEVIRPALKEHTDRFVPFLWTVFFFILFCNLLGQIPFGEMVTVFTGKPNHIGGTATGSLNTTFALALTAFVFIHLNGIWQVAKSLMDGTYGHHDHHEEHTADGSHGHEAAHDLEHVRGEGLAADVPADFKAMGNPTKHYEDDESFAKGHDRDGIRHGDAGVHAHGKGMAAPAAILMAVPLYFWNFAPHPFKPGPGGNPLMWVADVFMWGILLILEMIGAVIKPFALMIRLFANMIAGHIVLAALILLIPVAGSFLASTPIGASVTILSLLIRFLELFVAFLQAYIFMFLTTLFIASAVVPLALRYEI